MKVEKDFEDFIKLLNKNKVKYLIIGAFALALFVEPRNTGDIDIAIIAKGLSFDEFIQIKVNISELLLPYNIDIVDFNKISNIDLKEHIMRVGRTLFCK